MNTDTTGEKQLLCEIIRMAHEDATTGEKFAQRDAAAWFKNDSRYFRLLCALVEINPDVLRERALPKIFEREEELRAEKLRKKGMKGAADAALKGLN